MVLRWQIWVGISLSLMTCLSCSHAGIDGLDCCVLQVPGGYGYVVRQNGDTLILQPYMPAVGHRQAFRTEAEALRAGELVCRKLRRGLPPTLTCEEVENCRQQAGR
ncbi:MAG TPA: DUF4907 domain-containing protein [Candidatus Bacteroides merdipullorum]|uniref:DUF4907 domain-containing protein n=1 Tax=Candidatus Bacteroides merdipullorum TaxID=2838474 RepID=A0A9D2A3U1_9BACE|nr:DUF4907 domain-containing protein [Candidatus Bacteroides merdipullorum]